MPALQRVPQRVFPQPARLTIATPVPDARPVILNPDLSGRRIPAVFFELLARRLTDEGSPQASRGKQLNSLAGPFRVSILLKWRALECARPADGLRVFRRACARAG